MECFLDDRTKYGLWISIFFYFILMQRRSQEQSNKHGSVYCNKIQQMINLSPMNLNLSIHLSRPPYAEEKCLLKRCTSVLFMTRRAKYGNEEVLLPLYKPCERLKFDEKLQMKESQNNRLIAYLIGISTPPRWVSDCATVLVNSNNMWEFIFAFLLYEYYRWDLCDESRVQVLTFTSVTSMYNKLNYSTNAQVSNQ